MQSNFEQLQTKLQLENVNCSSKKSGLNRIYKVRNLLGGSSLTEFYCTLQSIYCIS